MKIAIVSPVMIEVPPKKYGGIELMVTNLALGLADRGHKITIFCAGGSSLKHKNIKLVKSTPYPTYDRLNENRRWEAKEILEVLGKQDDFDLIHFFYEPKIFEFPVDGGMLNLLQFFRKPLVVTFSNTTAISENITYYQKNQKEFSQIAKIFISERQRSHLEFLNKAQVIYNGIEVEKYKFEKQKNGYLFFLGRISKDKGILEAIEVAKKTKHKLVIAARISPVDQEFYEQKVKPLIDGKEIKYIGEINFKNKVAWLAGAKALVFPIKWEEPFGLVVTEAFACGTPVLTTRFGSMPEIIKNGYNGFISENIGEMIKQVGELDEIKPANCRSSALEFSSQKMVADHEKLYLKML